MSEIQRLGIPEEYIGGGHGSLVIPGKTDEDKCNELSNMIVYAHRLGFQVAVHASGNQAVDATVDGFIKTIREKPGSDPRHYVVHADFITPDCASRLADHNFGVATQPVIKTAISDFTEQIIGPQRSAYQWPTGTLFDASVNLSAGSDAPVTHPNWRHGIQSAVLRLGKDSGRVSGPEQCIGVEDAIRMYTINGAWQDHMEDVKGSIEVGKLADFCIIGDDILTIGPHEISDVPVLMTIVGGKIVHDAS